MALKHYLCIDTATIFPQVGVLQGKEWLHFERFEHVKAEVLWKTLRQWFMDFSWSGFIYNAGPGGTLGLHNVLMMIRIWKTLASYRAIPVGTYNGLFIASRLHPEYTIWAQVCREKVWRAEGGELEILNPEEVEIFLNALRFPAQEVAPAALRNCELLNYDLSSAATLVASSLQWNDSWKEVPCSSTAFVPWDRKRHGA
ncbi:MAG: hypothetical protein LBD40_04030 [Puniceicoccales bacterium]|jgi:hypothetical protein|nr:hypothetical protein [Puniceicoccales bacterium]